MTSPFPCWTRCPKCGNRTWIYTAKHMASVQKLKHREGHDMKRPFCDGVHVPEKEHASS